MTEGAAAPRTDIHQVRLRAAEIARHTALLDRLTFLELASVVGVFALVALHQTRPWMALVLLPITAVEAARAVVAYRASSLRSDMRHIAASMQSKDSAALSVWQLPLVLQCAIAVALCVTSALFAFPDVDTRTATMAFLAVPLLILARYVVEARKPTRA